MRKCKDRGCYSNKKPVNATEFDKFITIVDLTGGTSDGIGGTTDSEVVVHSTMAAIWPSSSKEQVENMRNELRVTHRIRFWFWSGIKPDLEVRFGAREFEIVGQLNPNEGNIVTDLICYERL